MSHPTSAQIVAQLVADLEALPSRSRLDDVDTEVIYALAYQLVTRGHYKDAFTYFAILTVYRPTEVKYLAGLALGHKMLQRYKAAIGVYAFMAAIDPTEPLHHLCIAECLLLHKKSQDARELLELVQCYCQEHRGHEEVALRAQAISALLSRADHGA